MKQSTKHECVYCGKPTNSRTTCCGDLLCKTKREVVKAMADIVIDKALRKIKAAANNERES